MNVGTNIPQLVGDQEKIVRIIYAPNYIKKDPKTSLLILRYQMFRSPPDLDEVSVTRLDYSSGTLCKQHGKDNEEVAKGRKYFGLAILLTSHIRALAADVVASPLPDNPAHADIKINYTAKKGEQLPLEFKYKVDEMAEMAHIYEDLDVANAIWTSGILM